MNAFFTTSTALAEIGTRIRAYRVDYPLTQAELSKKANVSTRSITRLENGEEVQFSTIIRILIALDLSSNLDLLIPDPSKRPSYHIKETSQGRHKTRVRKKSKTLRSEKPPIKWGDSE